MGGPAGTDFIDFATSYLAGSIALVVILFAGGLETPFTAKRFNRPWIPIRSPQVESGSAATLLDRKIKKTRYWTVST